MTNEELRKICIENNWFTAGSAEQYEKLFELNTYGKDSYCVENILSNLATIIWICSDNVEYKEIYNTIRNAESYKFSLTNKGC